MNDFVGFGQHHVKSAAGTIHGLFRSIRTARTNAEHRWSRRLYRHPDHRRYGMAVLKDYPTDVVTIQCTLCPRRYGRFDLGRLVRRLGPDRELDDVFDDLVRCQYQRSPHERPPRKYEPRCLARFMEWRG